MFRRCLLINLDADTSDLMYVSVCVHQSICAVYAETLKYYDYYNLYYLFKKYIEMVQR